MYLNLFKFLPVVGVFLLWAWTTHWVNDDAKELNSFKFEFWNCVIFFSGILGLMLVWALPIYPVGLTLLVLAYFIPLLMYVYVRNQTVPDDRKVLTPYHLGEVANGLMNTMGMKAIFNRDARPTAPARRSPSSARAGWADPSRVRAAEESRSYMSAKVLVHDAVLRLATDIHLEPTAEHLDRAIGSTASFTPRNRFAGPPATPWSMSLKVPPR